MDFIDEIIRTNTEYNLLPIQFFLLTFWGVWLPENLSRTMKKIYSIFFCVVMLLDVVLCIEMILFIEESIRTHSFKLLNIFLTSAATTAVYKAIITAQNREVIRSFIKQYFDHEFFKCENPEEEFIFEANNIQVRKVLASYSASMAAVFCMRAFSPMFDAENNEPMPVDAFYFYDIKNWYCYWLTYFHQVTLGGSVICAHIGVDTLFVGLVLKLSCQINLLKYRLRKVSEICDVEDIYSEDYKFIQKKMLFKCIEHHQMIYRFGKDLNVLFQELLFIQVITSIPNLCINIYILSKDFKNITLDYIAILFYISSALMQLFISCWYGNEVILNSLDLKNAVFNMDWSKFDISTRKIVILLMLRSSKPIELTVGYIIPMNIDSFIKIIKASYSAFNLLQQT